jgi:hypothetical protein
MKKATNGALGTAAAGSPPTARTKRRCGLFEMLASKMGAMLTAAALTMAVAPVLAAPVASAVPQQCAGWLSYLQLPLNAASRASGEQEYQKCLAHYGTAQPSAPRTASPVHTPHTPPPQNTVPVQQPPPPPTPPPSPVPVVTPKINPPASGAPARPLVAPPRGLDAPQQAIDAAKNAPATRVDPASPPPPATHVDVNQQVQNVVSAHSSNVDLVNAGNQALVRPSHWNYVDYDVYHRPALYNPISEAMTFRYFYNGAFREVYVPAGGRVLLDAATVGVFPFTAVSEAYVTAGSFYGGAWIPPVGWSGPPPADYTPPTPPQEYQDVSADVPADNQAVQVGQVTVVGHDDGQPAGSQDTFLLDDSTLAWGQVNPPGSNTQIKVAKTQSLPGVGPTDNGSILVKLAAHERPTRNWTPWALGGGVLVIAAGLFGWLLIRRKQASV